MSRIFPSEGKNIELPDRLTLALAEFMLDRRTGNVKLNIKDGKILGFRIEEVVSI